MRFAGNDGAMRRYPIGQLGPSSLVAAAGGAWRGGNNGVRRQFFSLLLLQQQTVCVCVMLFRMAGRWSRSSTNRSVASSSFAAHFTPVEHHHRCSVSPPSFFRGLLPSAKCLQSVFDPARKRPAPTTRFFLLFFLSPPNKFPPAKMDQPCQRVPLLQRTHRLQDIVTWQCAPQPPQLLTTYAIYYRRIKTLFIDVRVRPFRFCYKWCIRADCVVWNFRQTN